MRPDVGDLPHYTEQELLAYYLDPQQNHFFPKATLLQEEGVISFELIIDGVDVAADSVPLKDEPVSPDKLTEIRSAIGRFNEAAGQDGAIDRTKLRYLRTFALPDPDIEPDRYRLYGPVGNRGVLVLWGYRSPGVAQTRLASIVDRLSEHGSAREQYRPPPVPDRFNIQDIPEHAQIEEPSVVSETETPAVPEGWNRKSIRAAVLLLILLLIALIVGGLWYLYHRLPTETSNSVSIDPIAKVPVQPIPNLPSTDPIAKVPVQPNPNLPSIDPIAKVPGVVSDRQLGINNVTGDTPSIILDTQPPHSTGESPRIGSLNNPQIVPVTPDPHISAGQAVVTLMASNSPPGTESWEWSVNNQEPVITTQDQVKLDINLAETHTVHVRFLGKNNKILAKTNFDF